MPRVLLEFEIVNEKNRRLWVRSGAGFSATRALAALELLQARFPAIKMFLLALAAGPEGGPPRRLMLRNPNLQTASLQAEAVHGAEPGIEAVSARATTTGEPAPPSFLEDGALVDVEVWHRRLLIRHLNYPGLSFATEAPEHVARADFERVAEFLVPAQQPLNSVFRLSQITSHIWLPGEDRRSTSIGDVLVLKGGPEGGEDSHWMVMVTGFDRVESFE